MNPQPDPIVGNITAIIFVLAIVFYAIKAISENNIIHISDKLIIGYVDADPITINEVHHHHKTIKTVQTKTKTKKVVITKPDFESQQLYADCIDALVALGMKKREAQNKASIIFSTTNPQPKTIQEFLMIALKLP